jgi:hypothetical protein
MGFGTPMYYAVCLKKYRIVDMLDYLGCSVSLPCDFLQQTPLTHAIRLDDAEMIKLIKHCSGREDRAYTILTKNVLRIVEGKRFRKMIAAIGLLQRLFRRILAKRRVKALRLKLQMRKDKAKTINKYSSSSNYRSGGVHELDEESSAKTSQSSKKSPSVTSLNASVITSTS